MIPKSIWNYCNLPHHSHAMASKRNVLIQMSMVQYTLSTSTEMSRKDYDKLNQLEYIYLRNGMNHLFKVHNKNDHSNMPKLFYIILLCLLCVVNMTKNRPHSRFLNYNLLYSQILSSVKLHEFWKFSDYLFIFILL